MDTLSHPGGQPDGLPADIARAGPGDRILFWPQVKGMTGLSRSTVWRMQRVGEFPVSVQVSRGRVGWWESELSAWKRTRTPHRLPEPRPFEPRPIRAAEGGSSSRAARSRAVDVTSQSDAPGETMPESRSLAAGGPVLDPASRPRRRRGSAGAADQIAFDFGS